MHGGVPGATRELPLHRQRPSQLRSSAARRPAAAAGRSFHRPGGGSGSFQCPICKAPLIFGEGRCAQFVIFGVIAGFVSGRLALLVDSSKTSLYLLEYSK